MPITTGKTTGSSFSGPSTGPWGGGGGGGGNQTTSTTTTKSKNTAPLSCATHQLFTIECTGLKPRTLHDFYYEGVKRNQDCLSLGVAYGTAPWKTAGSSNTNTTFLTTDLDGKLKFSFYFTPNVEKEVDAANKIVYELAGNKKFEVRAIDSSASKIVPFTTK